MGVRKSLDLLITFTLPGYIRHVICLNRQHEFLEEIVLYEN